MAMDCLGAEKKYVWNVIYGIRFYVHLQLQTDKPQLVVCVNLKVYMEEKHKGLFLFC